MKLKQWVSVILALVLLMGALGACTKQTEAPAGAAGAATDKYYESLVVDKELTSNGVTTLTGVVSLGANPVFEGATADSYETTLAITDPTADRTITVPNSSGTIALNPYGASIEFEGATANDYETTVTVTDPTADRTVTIPDETGAVMMSSLATNGTAITNSVTGASNGLVFEGATADEYETTLPATDPTADRAIVLPDLAGTVHVNNSAQALTSANAIVTAPTAAATATPAMIVDSLAAGSLLMSVRKAATPWFEITNGGDTTASGALNVTGALAANGAARIAAPTAAATATPALIVDSLAAGSPLLSVRKAATPVFEVSNAGVVTGNVLQYGASGKKVVCGQSNVTGTAVVAHGLATPSYVQASIAGDLTGDAARVSFTNAAATVTVKVWNSALTPAPNTTPVAVDWCVIGTP